MKQTIIKLLTAGCKSKPVIKDKSLVKMQGRALICLLLPLLFCSKQSVAQVGSWTPIATGAPHYNYGEMMLLTDGRVIAKSSGGGSDTYGNTWDVLTPDASGSYVNGTWSSITPMNDTRLYFSGQVLPDGRVYVAGGEYGTGSSKGEVYNPKTNAWTSAGGIPGQYFSDANSAILPSGKVLQAVVVDTEGGTAFLSLNTFLYDPATNTYTAAPVETNGIDNESEWVKLPDSSILFCDRNLTGGFFDTMTAERYIPSTNTWVVDAPVPVELFDDFGAEDGPAFLLPNGKVFFMGGASTTAIYTPSGNSSPGTWEVGPAIPHGFGAPDAAAAMMNNGKILFALSPAPFGYASDQIFTDPVYFYEYDYTTNAFTLVPNMFGVDSVGNEDFVSGTYITNMLDLPDGNVMFTFEGYDEYWIYTPTGSPLAAGKPTIDNITSTGCTTYRVTGKLFNGISEGATYGDDWQMSTNYPIVRLTSGSNVYYATTSNWNRIGAVMTGALPDTAQFALPDGLPDATYSVVLIANGNPSDPVTITTSAHAITPSASTICVGRTVTLTDAVSGGIWSSSNADVTIGSASGVAISHIPGTAVISDSFGLCVAKATVTVITTPYPIAGTFDVCHGATTTLSAAPAAGIWTSSNAHAAVGAVSGIVTGESAGHSTITYSLGGSCRITTEVSVMPSPAVSLSDASACIGSKITMTSSPAYDSVVWSLGGTGIKTTRSPTGPSIMSVGSSDLFGPTGTFLTGSGDLYVADFNAGTVFKYPAGFNTTTPGIIVAQNGLEDPYSVFVDPAGNMYVGDGNGSVILEFPPGSDATTVGTLVGDGYGDFIADITVDPSGNIFAGDIAEGLVLEYAPGAPESPAILVSGLGSVFGIYTDANDTLYAADYTNNAIYKYIPLGGFGVYDGGTIVAGGNGGGAAANQFAGASGVFVDNSGSIYVTDNINGRVQKFPRGSTSATNGVTVAGTGGTGTGATQLNLPYHSHVDAAGNIYIADYGNFRVQVYHNPGDTSTTTTDTLTPGAGGSYKATVTDINGCTASSSPFAILPATAVSAIPAISVNTDHGHCSAAVSYAPVISAATFVTHTFTGATIGSGFGTGSGSVFNTGVTHVAVIAAGPCNRDTARFTVTVTDNEKPTITVSNVTVCNTHGQCNATVSLTAPVTHDNCGVAGVTHDHPSAVYPVGTTTVNWTVTDIHGNTNTAAQTVTVNDCEAPHAVCHNYTLTLSGSTGSITPANVNAGSYDNCGIAGMSVNPNHFTCDDAGTHTVTLTVTDIHGNTDHCSSTVTVQYAPACAITVIPGAGAYTGGVATTIYLGYGPNTATLNASATGGSGFTYLWSSPSGTGSLSNIHIKNPVFTASLPGHYTYTCTITNSNGCTTTCSVSMCVIDAVDHKIRGNVLICHNGVTLSLPPGAVPSHLPAHTTDHLGPCGDVCSSAAGREAGGGEGTQAVGELTVTALPNPFTNDVHLNIQSNHTDNVDVTVYDVTGKIREAKTSQAVGADVILGNDLIPGVYLIEVTQGEQHRNVKVVKY